MNKEHELAGSINGKRKLRWLLLITGVAAAALVALLFTPDAPTSSAQNTDIVGASGASPPLNILYCVYLI